MNCSYVHTDKTNGTKSPCHHPVYGKEKLCVFHSSEIPAKAGDFGKALGVLLDQAVASSAPVDLNFKGFIFPKADFQNFVFRGVADFRAAVFTDDVTRAREICSLSLQAAKLEIEQWNPFTSRRAW